MTNDEEVLKALKEIRTELSTIRQGMGKVIFYMTEAETEVTEKMRRFIMYMHDMHDVKNLYDEHGLQVPPWVLREVERCDDRLRQLLEELHAEGGTFAKVRAKMAEDPNNRWDHTRQLEKPRETRTS
jgi:hypothetical protein